MGKKNFNTEWRKVAAAMYIKPVDSKILGSVDIDVTDLEVFINRKRKKGVKITLTHCVTLALARGIRTEVPELNCYVKRGKIVERDYVDAMISVLLKREEMGSVRVPGADKMTLVELSDFLSLKIKEARTGNESKEMKKKGMIAAVPWPFRRWLFKLIKLITITWGFSVAGISANNYGSFVVANIGTLGLDTGYPALFPTSNVAMVVTMGGVFKKPAVVGDKVLPRKILTISVALDHRVVDASHGGKMFRYVKNVVRNPEILDQKPEYA